MKSLFQTILAGVKGLFEASDGAREVSPDIGRHGRSPLLSTMGTALLSLACLAVLWLQWERAHCEDRAVSARCSEDTRAEGKLTSTSSNDTEISPKIR